MKMSKFNSKFTLRSTPPRGKHQYRLYCNGTCKNHVSTQKTTSPTICPICESDQISDVTEHPVSFSGFDENGDLVYDVYCVTIEGEYKTITAKRGY